MEPIEPITYVASTTVSTSESIVPATGFDIFALIGNMFGGSEALAGFFSGSGILGFIGSLWSVLAIIAYTLSIIFLVFYVFATVRRNLYLQLMTQELRDNEELYAQKYGGAVRSTRLQDVLKHSASDSPNDWRLAIIEADIILDDTLKSKGYVGGSLGERLKGITSNQLASIDDAWEAHKIRNRIAHDGADFIITKRITEDTIARYQRVFREFGVI